MTTTTQTPGSTLQGDVTQVSSATVIAHGDTVTREVADALSALVADVVIELGPAEIQQGIAELVPATGTHGVMISLGSGAVVQVAVILDDGLHAAVVTPGSELDDPATPPVWLGAVSNAIDRWSRSQGSVVGGALQIERAAELDHLLVADDELLLVAAGLFHDGRHAGTVALVARGSDATAPSTDTGTAAAPAGLSAPAPTAAAADTSSAAGPTRAAALRALADVEMLVTVELGRTRMAVADLLDLGPGSVIELDRTAGSPIDLLVNGTLIARGEVVVIDEEYGIRLTEIVGSGEV